MLRKRRCALVLFLTAACVTSDPPGQPAPVPEDPVPTRPPVAPPNQPTELVLSVLTYNVAGLPQAISGSSPADNTPQISPLLGAYELVLVQEDFSYHDELAEEAGHPYQSEPMDGDLADSLGDGLNRFSFSPFSELVRQEWEECNGLVASSNDCLTPKGFTVATHELAGTEVDVYNLHMDAGRGSKDHDAREAQIAQLVRWIDDHSGERPLIIAGDTNLRDEEDELLLQGFLEQAGIVDACRALACPQPQLIDRVFTRSSSAVTIEPTSWVVAPEFVDDSGDPLSDHDAVFVELEIVVRP